MIAQQWTTQEDVLPNTAAEGELAPRSIPALLHSGLHTHIQQEDNGPIAALSMKYCGEGYDCAWESLARHATVLCQAGHVHLHGSAITKASEDASPA
jgi:hypothetical protein